MILAGPTCDSADVLYERKPYPLPISLEIGDELLKAFENALNGAVGLFKKFGDTVIGAMGEVFTIEAADAPGRNK